jgi:hypothetical protein
MEGVLAGLVNLGLGGLMAAALVWFLHHLVTRTVPEMAKARREELTAERDQRFKEHQALLQAIDKLGDRQRKEHEAILDRLDFGFKEIINELIENRAAIERRSEGRPPPEPGPATRRPRPQ